jgi:hypothetical protein
VQIVIPKQKKTIVIHYKFNKTMKPSNMSMKQLHFSLTYSTAVLPNVFIIITAHSQEQVV